MTHLSFVMMTWQRPASMLENSLWTLSHQTVLPDEIVVCEASPEESWHEETRRLCAAYPLVKLVEAHWSRFNISRGINCSIKAASPSSDYIAAVGMELLFSENFVETLLSKVGPSHYVISNCAILPPTTPNDPVTIRDNWEKHCRICEAVSSRNTDRALGATLCASREWWFKMRGYDEARRPYSYPDVDVYDRAIRSGLEVWSIPWEEAQVIHPWHAPSGLFYTISGYYIDNQNVDSDVVRNLSGWGELEGDEPVRIPGT